MPASRPQQARTSETHADVLCSKFKEEGYSSRQALGW